MTKGFARVGAARASMVSWRAARQTKPLGRALRALVATQAKSPRSATVTPGLECEATAPRSLATAVSFGLETWLLHL